MKKIFYLLFLLCAVGTVYAQERKKIDDYSMLFVYNYQFYEEHKNPESTQSFEMVLEIGNRYSKFYNPIQGSSDSILVARANQPYTKEMQRADAARPTSHAFCNYYIFKNYPASGKTSFFHYIAFGDGPHRVEEKLNFKWKIDNNATAVILGMNCKKATCRYAGRDYEAWFAPEIPISDGPYKFSGLPGLIVQIHDSDNEHVFELREIKKVNNKPMYLHISGGTYTKTSAKGFARALEASQIPLIEKFKSNQHLDPEAFARTIARIQKQNNFIERY